MSTLTTEFIKRKRQYEDENDLIAELEKNPMSLGQVKEMLTRGYSDYETAQAERRFATLIDDLYKRGLVVPDSPKSYDQFKKENPGLICIKRSTMQQMDIVEYDRFQKAFVNTKVPLVGTSADQLKYKGYKVYDDIPLDLVGQAGNVVRHYSYIENGKKFTSGSGYLVRFEHLNLKDEPSKMKYFSEASRLYNKARNEIDDRFKKLGLK